MPFSVTIVILSGVVSVIGWVVVHRFTKSRDTQNRRRTHKANIRLIADAFPDESHTATAQKLDEWWLRAIDDYSRFARRTISQRIAQFKLVSFPTPDWDVNVEEQ